MSDINRHNHQTVEKVSKPFLKNWFVWIGMIGIIPIVIFTVSWGYEFFFRIPAAKQAELEIEFKAIAPLPNASVVEYMASNKAGQALVDATYLTDINPDDIFKYYDEQLKQQGWQSQGTKAVKDWGTDLGGKAADYCKGDYGAELFYAGQQANYGWTYSFSVDWGLNTCKAGN